SDPLGILATPFAVVQHTSQAGDNEAILALIAAHQAELVLVGLPVSLDGHVHAQARRVQAFVERLRALTSVRVETIDERLSTVEAERRMREAGASSAQRRASRDAAAAAILLQSYLDRRRTVSDSQSAAVPAPRPARRPRGRDVARSRRKNIR